MSEQFVKKSTTYNVALMGKTNVGKSSLFNAIIGKNKAIVSPKQHVTRDAIFCYLPLITYEKPQSNSGKTKWRSGNKELSGIEKSSSSLQIKLMDLAGLFFPGETEPITRQIKQKAVYKNFEEELLKKLHAWISQAHLLIMVYDLHNITHEDIRINQWLKKNFSEKPVKHVANKYDSSKDAEMMGEVFSWKIQDPMWVSAKHHLGVDVLRKYIAKQGAAWYALQNKKKDMQSVHAISNATFNVSKDATKISNDVTNKVDKTLQAATKVNNVDNSSSISPANTLASDKPITDLESKQKENNKHIINEFCVSILGKPNAGKSSLLNALLKENRALVSSMPGTTRDAIDASTYIGGKIVRFIDTAGLRKKAKVHESVESFSTSQAVRALDASHLAILLVDASSPISEQDKKIAALANHHEKALFVVFNKWDLVSLSWDKFVDRQLFLFPLLRKFILLPLSVKNGFHFSLLRRKISEIMVSAQVVFKTSLLNTIAKKALEQNPPPIIRQSRKEFAIKYVVQVSVFPVKLRIYCARPQALNSSYETYLLNTFRKKLNLQGLPLRLYFEAPSSKKFAKIEKNISTREA